jgi:hypothetical protein
VPYFCAGDRYSPVAVLDAAVIVLEKPAGDASHGGAAQGVAIGEEAGDGALAQGGGGRAGQDDTPTQGPAPGATDTGGGADLRGKGAGARQAGAGAVVPRRAVSPPRPSLLAPTPFPHPSRSSFSLVDAAAEVSSDHAHVDETRCDDCNALDGYRFGGK